MRATLTLESNIEDPDAFYDALIAAHRTLTEAQSAAFNARLVLVLANHIGNGEVLAEALAAAAR